MHYIQIGLTWLGVVSENGEIGAVWTAPAPGAKGGWKSISQSADLLALWKGVQVHQGQAVPQLVSLPFNTVLAKESDEMISSQLGGTQ